MPSYETTVDVGAPVATVWAVTRDVGTWPDWSPTMDSVVRRDSGPIGPGSSARVKQPGLGRATWVVDRAEEDRAFVWHTAGLGYRIDAEHLFTPRDDRTGVLLRVSMSGPLSGALWRMAGARARRYLDEEAAALKARCEGGAGSGDAP